MPDDAPVITMCMAFFYLALGIRLPERIRTASVRLRKRVYGGSMRWLALGMAMALIPLGCGSDDDAAWERLGGQRWRLGSGCHRGHRRGQRGSRRR